MREGEPRARRDRDRGRHRGQTRGARRALPGPGRRAARVGARLRADAGEGRRPGRATARGLVRVSLPAGDRLRPVAVAHSDPEKVAFARAYQERYPSDIDAPTGSAQVLRDGASQLLNRIDDALLETVVADPEQRELVRTSRPARRDGRPDGGRGPRDRRHHVRRRRVRARLQPFRPRAGRGARPAGGHRGRERAPIRGTLAHRRHAPARPAARRAAGHRGPAAGLPLPPGG